MLARESLIVLPGKQADTVESPLSSSSSKKSTLLTDAFCDVFGEDGYDAVVDAFPQLARLRWQDIDGQPLSTDQWGIQDSSLVTRDPNAPRRDVFKGALREQFAFSATMKLYQSGIEGQPAFGLGVRYSDQERLSVRFLQSAPASWVLAVESEGVQAVTNRVLALPKTFDVTQWHMLGFVQEEGQITVLLDGEPVLNILEPARPAQVGLTVQYAIVAFTNVTKTCIS